MIILLYGQELGDGHGVRTRPKKNNLQVNDNNRFVLLVYNYILYLLDLQSKMWTVCLFYRKNTNGNKLTKPSLKKKIETKKRSLPKVPLDHLMESPTDTR